MNIKEHIEAGHYPKDDKGRAVVPVSADSAVVIYATDYNSIYPIVGVGGDVKWAQHWGSDGAPAYNTTLRLLPPPPRKVRAETWGIVWPPTGNDYPNTVFGVRKTEDEARAVARSIDPRLIVVPLSGEYEDRT